MSIRARFEKISAEQWAFAAIWLAMTMLYLVPIWNQRLLPMLDTPNHLALIRGWHSYHDPSYRISEYFEMRIRPVPYLLFYASVHYLMYLFPIETAYKVFLSIYVILFPLSVLSLAHSLRRRSWLVFGAFPLIFNPSWIYGYSSLMLGNCFAFFSLASLIRYLRDKRERELPILLVLVTCTFFSHILPWFIFGLAAICLLVMRWRDWRFGARAVAAMVPSLIFAVTAMVEESSEHAYLKDPNAKLKVMWFDVPTLLTELPKRILGIMPGYLDMLVLAVLVATVFVVWAMTGRRSPDDDALDEKQIPMLMILLGLLYLALPYQIYGPIVFFQMAQRIPALATCVFLLVPTCRLVGRRRLVVAPLILAAALLPLGMARRYRDFNDRNIAFMWLLNEIPRGKTVMVAYRGMWKVDGPVAESSGDPATRAPVYWHFPSWPMALRGGFSAYLFDQGIPIHYKKKLKAPQHNLLDGLQVRDAPEFDYYLIKDAPSGWEREPALRLVNQIEDWSLYERIYDVTEEP